MKNPTEIWDQVCKTDPSTTRKVKQRGGFTAINAQSQVKRATEIWGPMGYKWGVENEDFQIHQIADTPVLVYRAGLFYHMGEERCYVSLHSSIKMVGKYGVEDDTFKKVATDALTKGLSKLGFNSDVFEGRFDDNKYVAEMTKLYTKEKPDSMEARYRRTVERAVGTHGADGVKKVHTCLGVIGRAKATDMPKLIEAWSLIGDKRVPNDDELEVFRDMVMERLAHKEQQEADNEG